MQEFLYMDGKGVYVWSAYGITAIALVWSVIATIYRRKKIIREIEDSLED